LPPPPAAPPPPKRRWRREWGLNLRLEGASFGRGRGAAEEAGMGGVGLSLRYRPVPAFAIDAGVDVLAGKDYNGFERTEVPLSLNGIIFFNPRSRVQFYMMGGVHVSHAEVEVANGGKQADEYNFTPNTEYDYFGGQGGIGLEFRLSRRIALNIDAIGFIRDRTDDNKHASPEFTDPETGRTTNTSGGGLFRGGLTVYW
jgi:opacity protein-like surface antigen